MANLKRILTATLALTMVAGVMGSCGKKDSTTVDSKANAAAAEKGPYKQEKAARIEQTAEGNEESKNTLRIYTWNEEFKNRLRGYYSGYDRVKSGMTEDADGAIAIDGKKYAVDKDGNFVTNDEEYLTDGTKIEWVTTPNEGNQYQEKLDTDLKAQAGSETKIDMFLIEADYALKYVNGPYVKPVKELGLTDDDLADQYAYTKGVVTDANGDLEGVSWQATPGLFAYRRDIAKEVLGTDDPDEVQAMLSDWTKFDEVAAKMKEKGYCMLSGYDDSFRVFSNNVKNTWVNADKEIVIDDNLMAWVDQTKTYTDNGYNNKTSLWSPEWGKDQSAEGKVFGFFYSTWGIDFTLSGNAGEALFGQYAVCEGPQAYYWGGTWMCAADGTDNEAQVLDIMKVMTCDQATLTAITDGTQDYTNTVKGMEEKANSDFKSDFLGGQNHIALFSKSAPNIDVSNMGPYDQGLNESFQEAMKDYFNGTVDKDTALSNFYKAAIEKYPDLKTPS